jgi:PAS domain S-box-containing protein
VAPSSLKMPLDPETPAPRWFRYQIVPTASGGIMLAREITGRKRMEQALERTTRQLTTLMDTVPHGFFMKDERGTILAINRTMAAWLSKSPEDLVGRQVGGLSFGTAEQRASIDETDRAILDTGTEVEFEMQCRPEQGAVRRTLLVSKRPIRDDQGRVVGLVGFAQDISARKRADEELRRSKALLQAVFDAIPHAVYVKDREDRYLIVNQATQAWASRDQDSLLGQHSVRSEERHPEDLAVSRITTQEIFDGADRVDLSRVIETPTFGRRQFLNTKVPLRDENGDVIGAVGISEDITERVRVEQELRASQRMLETVFDAIPHFVYVKDLEDRYVRVNRALAELSPNLRSPIGRRALNEEGRPEGELAHLREANRRVLEGGERISDHGTVTLPNGSVREYHSVKVPLRDAFGRVTGLIAVSEDITERRRAERQLRESRALLQAVFDAIPHAIFVKDPQDRYVAVNRATEALLPSGSGSVVGQSVLVESVRDPADLALSRTTTRQVVEGAERVDFSRVLDLPHLGRREFHTTKVPLRDQEGRITGVLGVSEDVTERVRAERELRSSQTLLQAVFDAIPHFVFVKDREQRYIKINRAMEQYAAGMRSPLGLRAMNEPGRTAEEIEQIVRNDTRILGGGEERLKSVGNVTLPNGQVREFLSTKIALRDRAGQVMGIVGVSEDITDRLRAERELQESRSLLRALLDGIPHAVYAKDATLRIRMVNRAMEEFWRQPASELLGKHTGDEDRRSPEEIGNILEEDRHVLNTGTRTDTIVRYVDPQGQVRLHRIVRVPQRDESGKIIGLVGTTEDFTERASAEESLRKSQALLQAVFDTIPHELMVKGSDGRVLMVNRRVTELWQDPVADIVGKVSPRVKYADEEDLESIRSTDEQVLRYGLPFSGILRRRVPDGAVKPFQVIKSPLRDEHGRVVGLVAMAEDVADRLSAEAALKENQRLLRAILDTLPEAVYVMDRQGRYTLVNVALAERNRVPSHRLIGRTREDLGHTQAAETERLREADARVLATGEVVELSDLRTVLPDGTERWERDLKAPLRDADGQIVGIVGIAEDITERRRIAEAVQESRRLLQAILDTIPETVYVKDRQRRYTLVNDAMVNRQRLSRETMLGRTVEVLTTVSSETAGPIHDADAQVLSTGGVVELPETRLEFKDGSVLYERHLKAPLRNAAGEIVGVVGIAEDITARVLADRALKDNQRLLRTIIDTLPEAIFVKDSEGRYQLVNTRHAETYGLAPREFLGRRTRDLPRQIDSGRMEVVDMTDRQVLEEGKHVEIPELRFQPHVGEELWERLVKVPLRNDQGQIVGIVGLREDITSRKKAEDERIALDRLLQRTQNLESLGAMAGGIAHDFNNLLQRILGYAELALLEIEPTSPATSSVNMIHNAGVSAVELTKQMLTLSGRSRFALELVNLDELNEGCAVQARRSLPQGVEIVVEHVIPVPAVMADSLLLRQVLHSLISNGAEALDGHAGRIVLTAGPRILERTLLNESYSDRDIESGLYGYLEVRDTGPGIPKEARERLFEPFRSTKFMGRGLGLAAVRGIVRGHRGTIQVLSEPGQGAIFRILLPASAVAPPPGNVSPEGI